MRSERFARVLAVFIFCMTSGIAASAETVEEFLERFHRDPSIMMRRLPSVVEASGSVTPRGQINEALVELSMKLRSENRREIVEPRFLPERPMEIQISPEAKDQASVLVEPGEMLFHLPTMERRRLTKSSLETPPWADSYWPYYKGIIAARYTDKGFPNSKDFLTNFAYVQSRPASAIFASGDESAINSLSPAEKYDAVVGDSEYTLTDFSWRQGQKQVAQYGRVASWMGICHGWAAAAHMQAPFPKQPVRVLAANGRAVTFYPGDIRALQSMLWANTNLRARFVGNRCNVVRPRRNANGRIIDSKCFDTNPATFHLALVNQLGIHRRSFVIDSTYDLEVWNYAVTSYDYKYFNPQTWREGQSLKAAMIPMSRFKVDKFREFRSPNAKYIVGIAMDVTHVSAVSPIRGVLNSNPTKTLRMIYDLELDADQNIIGGEWYSNAHPDFLWTFDAGAQATAVGEQDLLVENWALNETVPSHWRSYARRASAQGEPLWAFIRRIATPGGEDIGEVETHEPDVLP